MVEGIDELTEDFILDIEMMIDFFNNPLNRKEKVDYCTPEFFTDQQTFFILSYNLGYELQGIPSNTDDPDELKHYKLLYCEEIC